MKRVVVILAVVALTGCQEGWPGRAGPATGPKPVALVAVGGDALIGVDAGTLVPVGALIGVDAGTLIGVDAGTVAQPAGFNPIGWLLPSPPGAPPAPARPAASLGGTLFLPAGVQGNGTVYLQDGQGRLVVDGSGDLVSAAVTDKGFTFPGVRATRAVGFLAPLGLEGGRPYGLVGFKPAGVDGVEGVRIDAASTLLVTWLQARAGWDDATAQRVPATAWQAARDAVEKALAADASWVPSDWRPGSVRAAVEALVVARPALAPLLAALVVAPR
jgi:hypothetical protein